MLSIYRASAFVYDSIKTQTLPWRRGIRERKTSPRTNSMRAPIDAVASDPTINRGPASEVYENDSAANLSDRVPATVSIAKLAGTT